MNEDTAVIRIPQTARPLTPSLFTIEARLAELVALLDECETDEEREATQKEIQAYFQQEVRKADGIVSYLLFADQQEAAAKSEITRLEERRRTWKARLERVKEATLLAMQTYSLKKIEGKTHTLAIRANGGADPVVVTEPGLIPARMQQVNVTMPLDTWEILLKGKPGLALVCTKIEESQVLKEKVRDALKEGPVAGAHVGERGSHLRWS